MGRLGEAREIVTRLRSITPQVDPSALLQAWRKPKDHELLLLGLRLAVDEKG